MMANQFVQDALAEMSAAWLHVNVGGEGAVREQPVMCITALTMNHE
jgi:hypothetical protein